MAERVIQSSTLEAFIGDTLSTSDDDKGQITVNEPVISHSDATTWKVGTCQTALKRKVSSSTIKKQNERFVTVLEDGPKKTGSRSHINEADVLRDTVKDSPRLDSRATAMQFAHRVGYPMGGEVNAPQALHSDKGRPGVMFPSVQHLFDCMLEQFKADVDLNYVQIDLNDLDRLDGDFKINGVKLRDLVDPQTGKLPLRTALIAYLLQFPDEKVKHFTDNLTATTLWLSFTEDPEGTSGVGDILFDEIPLANLLELLTGHSVSRGSDVRKSEVLQGFSSPASTVSLDLVNTKFEDLREKTLSVYSELAYLPQSSQQYILDQFIECIDEGITDQWTAPRNNVNPRLPIILDQVSTLISDLRDQGIEDESLGSKAEWHLYRALVNFNETPFPIRHIRLSNLLLDSKCQFDEVQRLHMYTPGPVHRHPRVPEHIKSLEYKKMLLALDPNNTIVIGNGGGGTTGLIQHLAKRFQTAVTKQAGTAPTIVWRFADSNQNFDVINHIDLAITYVPFMEQQLLDAGQLAQVKPVFFNHLELVAPKHPPFRITAGIRGGQADDPIGVLAEIMIKSMGLKAEDGEPKKTYFSRYNASAIGTKDEVIFRKAIKKVLTSQQRLDVLNKAEIDTVGLNEGQIEASLYKNWITHVVTDRGASAIDAVRIADSQSLFHLNDRAILLKQSISPDRLLTRTPNKVGAVLLNSAQLISAKHSLTSPQSMAFVNWLTGEEGQAAVRSFRLREGDDKLTQPYEPVGGTTFDELTAVAESLEVGTEVDKIWRPESTQY